MSEFGQQDDPVELSMNLSPNVFNATIVGIADTFSDDLAYSIYSDCLGEDHGEQPEDDIRFKRGLLFKFMGEIEKGRGDYDDALASYRQAQAEIVGFDELWSLQLFVAEGHLLMHEFDDPTGSIEPYKEAVRIYENRFVGTESEIAPHAVFASYTDVMGHLAGAYSHTGEDEKVRELNGKLASLGVVASAIFGFDSCQHGADDAHAGYEQKPIFKEIKEKLTGEPSLENAELQVEELRSLERLIDREDFMPDVPEQREHVLLMIYGKYGMLMPNLKEQEVYIKRALKIANRHGILVPKTQLYLSLGNNQAARRRPLSEQHKTMKKALLAAEASLDAGASAEAPLITTIVELLMAQMSAKGDYIGIEKTKRRLASRGIEVKNTMPGAARPELN